MCISPITIKNPNFDTAGNFPAEFRKVHNTTTPFIQVPCGNCPACHFTNQSGYYQRILEESRCSYVYFATLTLNENIEYAEYKDTLYTVAPYRDFQLMIKRIKKDNLFSRPFSYFAVREYGKKKGRAHFHILFFVRRSDGDTWITPYQYEDILHKVVFEQWRRNVGTSLNPEYVNLTTYREKHLGGKIFKNFDLHFVESKNYGDIDNVFFYVTKYLLKDNKFINRIKAQLKEDNEISREDFLELRRLIVRNSWRSLHFGLPFFCDGADNTTRERISQMIERSLEDGSEYPQYFTDDGRAFPLSRFYRDKFLTYEQNLVFKQRQSIDPDDFFPKRGPSPEDVLKQFRKGEKVMSMQRDFDIIDVLDE